VKDDCELKIEALQGDGTEISVASSAESAVVVGESGLPVPSRRVEDQNAKVAGERRDPTEKADRRKDQRRGTKSNAATATSIRVDTVKIDSLINMVGELIITQSMLGLLGELIEENRTITPQEIEKMRDGLTQLERNTRELQENVMQVRMMPISFTSARFPRLVRDLSGKLGKKIELKMTGENTEVDKNIIEKIGDPLVHLVRNSLDHGIEMPEDRLAAGKNQTGTINLNAYHGGGNIVIEIIDDGKGLNKDVLFEKGVDKGLIAPDDVLSDKQIFDIIFMAGFSTAKEVTDVSGRGVGMDVVRRNIMELGGNVEIDSTLGVGTKMTI
jgi:two-component system, chemotaxis family, sensor kinase CheA